MKKWVTAIAVLVGLSAVGSLVYWQWDPIWAFVFSPVGGFVTKVVFTTKALKVAVGAGFAVAAGVVAARRRRRGTPELPPPVYGPPDEEVTSAGTATATTTESPKAPASQPI